MNSRGLANLTLGIVVALLVTGPTWAQVSPAEPTATETAATETTPEVLSLDLERVIERALRDNPALHAEAAQRDEVLGRVDEVRADAYPTVDLVASWSRSRNPSLLNSRDFEDIIELFPDFEPGEQELWDVGIEATQTLYSGGKVRAAIELAQLVVDVTDARFATARLDTGLRAAEALFELQAASQARDAVVAQETARRAALDVVQARYDLGDATELERLRAEASWVAVAPLLARAEGRIEVAGSRLRAVLDLPPATRFDVPTPSGSPSSDGEVARPDLDTLRRLAAEYRPELADLRLQLEALTRQRTIEVADGRPRVEFRGRYGHQARRTDDLDDTLFADWRATVAMTLNLFDAGRRRGRLAQLDSQGERLRWLVRDLETSIEAQLTEAWADHGAALGRLRAAEVALRASAEARRVADESFREGVALQADLIGAQEQEIRAQLERVDARLAASVALARLHRVVGLLPHEPLDGGSDFDGTSSREEN